MAFFPLFLGLLYTIKQVLATNYKALPLDITRMRVL